MKNIFENHPSVSIILYTITISGISIGAMNFIFDENKIKSYEGAIIQLNTKASVLEEKLRTTELQNIQYFDWLKSDPKSFPSMENRVSMLEHENEILKKEIDDYRRELRKYGKLNFESKSDSIYNYVFLETAKVGETLYDPRSKIKIKCNYISSSNEGEFMIYLPGEVKSELIKTKSGNLMKVNVDNHYYSVAISNIDWIFNTYRFIVTDRK